MQVHTGTSGFSFDEWHGNFYPQELAADERLEYYSAQLSSVEINNTFYQMPKAALLERWRKHVPEHFRFALKAPRRITHVQRLKDSGESIAYFLNAATALEQKLGPLLFQLPPFLRKDTALLADFLVRLPSTVTAAFEFRHPSWFDDEVYGLLAEKNAALCLGDVDKSGRSAPFVPTASFGYLRLRAEHYDSSVLRDWSKRILEQRWTNAYVFLKHEAFGPEYAQFLAAVTAGAKEPVLTAPAAVAAAPAEERVRLKKGLARTKPSTETGEGLSSGARVRTRRKSA